MPFLPTSLTLERLEELGLPASYEGKEAFVNRHANATLIRREYWEGRDPATELILFIGGQKYVIEKLERLEPGETARLSFRVLSNHALSSHQSSQIKKHAQNALIACLSPELHRPFNLEVIDRTKPIPPRSLSRLSKALQNFADMLDKPQCYSSLMELFIPSVMSAEEATLFHQHIRKSGGKGISKVDILVFELGYEKYRSRSSPQN